MRFLRPLFIGCFLLGFLHSAIFAGADRLQLYYHIAEGNYHIGDLGGAERGIEQMLRVDPAYAPALSLQARVLLEKEKNEAALKSAQAAVKAAPDQLKHQLLEALILGKLDKKSDALVAINKVLGKAQTGSDDARAAGQLKGLMEMSEGNWSDAAKTFTDIYESAPETSSISRKLASEAYLEKAQSQLVEGRYDEAIKSIDQAIALYDEATGSDALQARDSLRLIRAKTLVRIGQIDSAIAALRRLIAQSPNKLEAVTTLASIYATTEQWESLDDLMPSITAQRELADIAFYLEGRIALARDRVGTARKKFEEAIELQKKKPTGLFPTLLFYEGLCLQRLGRLEAAQAKMEEAIAKNFQPEAIAEAVTLGSLLLRTGRSKEAIPILEKALLSLGQGSAPAWTLLARAHDATGNHALAISALNESLKLNSEQSTARALRGSLLRRIGDLRGALVDYEAASVLDPTNSAFFYALALTHLQLGQLKAAEQKLSLANKLATGNAGQQLLHALLAQTIGKDDAALDSLKSYHKLVSDKASPSAHYLNQILNNPEKQSFSDPIIDYILGKTARKEVLNWAGHAETPEIARAQICAAAYWMAQHEKNRSKQDLTKELLQIALDIGSAENPEWQFAQWQLTFLYTDER